MTRPADVQARALSPVRPVGRTRGVGYWAFVLHRASGLVLTGYLLAHLAFLSALYRGPEAYDAFVRVASQPVALFFDVLLVAAVIYHGFNGVRLAAVGLGLGRVQRELGRRRLVGLGLMALRILGGEWGQVRGMLWVAQTLSGALLLALLGLHLLANHTAGGLLTYAAVLRRLQDPLVFAIEVVFLVVVAFHGLNGLRAVALDYLAEEKAGRWINIGFGVLGLVVVAHGFWLSLSLFLRQVV